MKPKDREDIRYAKGYVNPISLEEERMFSFLPKGNGLGLLDVGCGVGNISIKLKKRGFDVYGLDFSSVAVRKASEKGINAKECDLDSTGIPFEDDFFDVVWAGDVVEHVFDPISLLKEMQRVVKRGGKILLSVPNDMNLVQRIIIFITGKSPQSDIYRNYRQCKHHTLFSLELLEYMLAEAEIRTRSIGSKARIPKIDISFYTCNRVISKLFGQVFIVDAYKSK